jgi:hypothetical protein
MNELTVDSIPKSLPKRKFFTLNENLKERRLGYFFMVIFLGIMAVYLFYDGWLYEWVEYGYDGVSQHWDFNIFGDMVWNIGLDGHQEYTSTNNLHNVVYICYWTATIAYLALITGNDWLRQGAIATMAFPVISGFSTINPMVAADVFTLEIFHYHTFIIQIMYDLTHVCGAIMAVYIFYSACKRGEEINFKKQTPTIMFTWVLYLLARIFLQKSPYWAEEHRLLGMISTNQVNTMPFYLYGFEFIIVVVLLYLINIGTKAVVKKIKNPKIQTLVPFAFFISLTIILIATGLTVLQVILPEWFLGNV